jgi:hypothetical protein
MYYLPSYFIYNIENSDYTISSSHSKHITWIAKIDSEGSSAEISDLSTWFEESVTIKDLDFIAARTSRNNEISGSLLELSTIYLAWILGS